jgi:flagellar basal-body rod protein FlgF
MSNDITSVSSSLEALTREYRTITHNIANANTPGYKRRLNVFSQALQQAESSAPGVDSQKFVDFRGGRFVQTDRKLDVALDGPGFFTIETPEGPIYTRHGSFRTNARGQLVDGAGRLVGGEGGPISVPANVSPLSVRISPDGTVSAAGGTLGRLRVVEFTDPRQLTPVGQNAFAAPEDVDAEPAEETNVHQGFVEGANVSVVEELVGLISLARMYEANLKTITKQDERLRHLLNVASS